MVTIEFRKDEAVPLLSYESSSSGCKSLVEFTG